MRVCSTISVSMLAAAAAATEAEWSADLPNLDLDNLLDGVNHTKEGSDYLSGYGAFEPSKAEPFSHFASHENFNVGQAYPQEHVEYAEDCHPPADCKDHAYT